MLKYCNKQISFFNPSPKWGGMRLLAVGDKIYLFNIIVPSENNSFCFSPNYASKNLET
jgi:hypothetical protein